ncbi:MAG TPA: peptidylprolyl isomerase [Gammaproteobacteria bacterium]|nr:peptidylprolyl isomerase [Gammaproteobacteria bacterium]
MNITKLVRHVAFIAGLSFISLNAVATREVLDKVIAVVNSDVISQYELDSYAKLVLADIEAQGAALPSKEVLHEQMLNRIVLDKIQVQLAAESGIEVDSITVSEAIQYMAKQKGQTLDEFKSSIERKGIAFEDYRTQIRNDLTIQRLQAREVARDVVIAKADVESYLSSPAGQDHSGTEYKLNHILLLTPESPTPAALKVAQSKADDLVANLKKGADFEKTAMTKSAGRQALNGGDLGWRTVGELPTLFVTYVPTMQVGEIVGPIRSAGGFHIIKLAGKRVTNNEKDLETHVRQILIVPDGHTSSEEAQKTLLSLRKQILNGADFAKLAQKKSQDLRSSAKGGDIGWVREDAVLPQFYEVMSKLKNSEISEPFQTEEGWNLIQVLDRRTQHTSNEAAWNKAMEVLTMRKTNEAIEAWTKRIRDEARIEIISLTNANKQA